jgi:hypothetical protein
MREIPEKRVFMRRYTKVVDGKASGVVSLFTVDKSLHPIAVRCKLKVVSGFVSACTLSIGTNAATYNDLVLATALTGLATVSTFLAVPLISPVLVIAAGTLVRANVTVVAIGTTYSLELHLLGDEA